MQIEITPENRRQLNESAARQGKNAATLVSEMIEYYLKAEHEFREGVRKAMHSNSPTHSEEEIEELMARMLHER